MKLVIIRLIEGCPYVGRAFDVFNHPTRDKNYGHVVVPQFEADIIELGLMSINGLSPEQSQMVKMLAMPLFPECCEGNITEGEDWKKE